MVAPLVTDLALDVLGFLRTVPASEEIRSIGGQLIRSATGVASNYRSSCRSRSRAEFIARIGIALDEADESALWLEIITEGKPSTSRRGLELLAEANELSAILAQSSLTANQNLRR